MLRVRLRRPKKADAAEVAPWLPEAVAAIQGRGASRDDALRLPQLLEQWDEVYPTGTVLVGELRDGPVVGLVRVRERTRRRVIVDALAVRADMRNLGYGQEMVIGLERRRGMRAARALAGVPRTNGLALYFWLRMGYRPLYSAAVREPQELSPELLWMVRDLT